MASRFRASKLLASGVLAGGLVATPLANQPALAAEGPRAEQQAKELRGFTLTNDTGRTIVEAHAYTTTGKEIDLTKPGPIRSQLAQNFMVERAECVDRVQVRLDDGKTMSRDHLNDCKDPRLVARDAGITVETSAAKTAPSQTR